jgi:lantibiotic modifying enzyme
LELAGRVAGWFDPKRIAADEELDVIGGAAGGILGLLALSSVGGDDDALEPAVQCGDHLLQKRATADTGHRVWSASWAPRPLTGFSHGAAGMAYALLRLSRATGEERFRSAAEEAIAYETAVYSSEARNWPDFRIPPGTGGDRFLVAWCHGAAGVGLARIGGLCALDAASVRADITNALGTTLAAEPSDVDHICCGEMGRVDLMIEGHRRLERTDLLDEARRRAGRVLRQARQSGRYRLYDQDPGVPDSPSLFQGTAGIGYELLRLAEPERLPSVLLWQ